MENIDEIYIQWKKGIVEEHIIEEIKEEWIIEWIKNMIQREESEEMIKLFLQQLLLDNQQKQCLIGRKNISTVLSLRNTIISQIHNYYERNNNQQLFSSLHCFLLYLQIQSNQLSIEDEIKNCFEFFQFPIDTKKLLQQIDITFEKLEYNQSIQQFIIQRNEISNQFYQLMGKICFQFHKKGILSGRCPFSKSYFLNKTIKIVSLNYKILL